MTERVQDVWIQLEIETNKRTLKSRHHIPDQMGQNEIGMLVSGGLKDLATGRAADDADVEFNPDITPYDLAQRLVDGRHVTDAGKIEIARELLSLAKRAKRTCPELLHTEHCGQCGWSGTAKDSHHCPGIPGENEF